MAGMIIFSIAFWIIMAMVVGGIASNRGHSGWLWFLYGFVIWPVAFIHILLTPATPEAARQAQLQGGRVACPYCAEPILPLAKICPHCRSDLPGDFSRPVTPALAAAGAAAPLAKGGLSGPAYVTLLVALAIVAIIVVAGIRAHG